jgi:hypothetical protein
MPACGPENVPAPSGRAPLRILLTVFLLPLSSHPASTATVPTDLDLDRAAEIEIYLEPGPNPHDVFPCRRCHEETDLTYEMASKYDLEIPLTTDGDSSILLCEECHGEGYHAFHPMNFVVKRLAGKIEEAEIFPLETIVEGYDKLTCTTCHDVHFPHTRNRLLRGFAVTTSPGEGFFPGRVEFCRACHGDEVNAIAAHREEKPDEKCNFCHLGYRKPGVPGPLKRRLNESCVICHPIPRGRRPHFYSYNPFPDFKREELEGYGLSLEKGQFTCSTCHTHHRPPDSSVFLRPAFISVVSKSLRVTPHRTTRFCQNCHPFKPPPIGTPNAEAPLWEEDVTRLCRGCHEKASALHMHHHPVSKPSEAVAVPADWKLRKDGTLGCQTCHLAGHGPPDPLNLNMLRGGPYRYRNGICFRCHDRNRSEGRNIHLEVVEFGGCDFCHIVKERTALSPEGKVGDILAEPNFLCLLCHTVFPHPASADHTVRPKKYSFLTLDEEITPLFMGSVTCHTCHESHSIEVGENLLRKVGSETLTCRNCHPF